MNHSEYPVKQLDYVVIVGPQPSGTTLMGQMPGSCKGVVLIEENDGLYTWARKILN